MNTVYMTVEIQLPYPIEYNIIQIYSSNGKKGVIFIYRFLVSLFKKTILHCIKKNLVASLKIWGYIGEPNHFFITSEFKKKISISVMLCLNVLYIYFIYQPVAWLLKVI